MTGGIKTHNNQFLKILIIPCLINIFKMTTHISEILNKIKKLLTKTVLVSK